MIGARFYTQLDSAQLRSDVVETELAKVSDIQFNNCKELFFHIF